MQLKVCQIQSIFRCIFTCKNHKERLTSYSPFGKDHCALLDFVKSFLHDFFFYLHIRNSSLSWWNAFVPLKFWYFKHILFSPLIIICTSICAWHGLEHWEHHSHWGTSQVGVWHNRCAQGTMENHSTMAAMAPVSQIEDCKIPPTRLMGWPSWC